MYKFYFNKQDLTENTFKKKYLDLEKKYHQKYEEYVDKHLKKEVQKKFKVLLKKDLKKQKAVLSQQEFNQLKSKAEKEFEIKKDEFKKKLIDKENIILNVRKNKNVGKRRTKNRFSPSLNLIKFICLLGQGDKEKCCLGL